MANSPASQPPLAITGGGYKALRLVEWLEQDKRFSKLLLLAPRKPDFPLRKTKFHRIDLTETLADVQLAEILEREKIATLVHSALPMTPPHQLEKAHELIVVGSMYVCNAAAKAKVRKLVLATTADIYGAHPMHPNYIGEEQAPRGGQLSRFLADKIEAERFFLNYAKKYPQSQVTLLRHATILGPRIESYKTRYLNSPLVPTVLGFDPLVQFTHEQDLLSALRLSILQDCPGVYNIASRGVIPLSRAIRLMGKIPTPLPLGVLKACVQWMWYFDLSPAPASHLDFLKYSCVLATDLAKKKLGFRPEYSCQDALAELAGAARLRSVQLEQKPTSGEPLWKSR